MGLRMRISGDSSSILDQTIIFWLFLIFFGGALGHLVRGLNSGLVRMFIVEVFVGVVRSLSHITTPDPLSQQVLDA